MDDSTNCDALGAREGSQERFLRLHARVAPALAAWARVRTAGALRDLMDPDDLVQEVWWRALDGFRHFDPKKGSYRAWIFGIAANCFRQALRRSPSARLADTPGGGRIEDLPSQLQDSLTSVTTDLRRRESVARLAEVVDGLEADDRQLFIHCGLEGMPCKDAGAALGISPNAAVKRWRKLRERLETHPVVGEFLEPEA